jgi:hypothetical protein
MMVAEFAPFFLALIFETHAFRFLVAFLGCIFTPFYPVSLALSGKTEKEYHSL